jgi:hypothetical protein
LSVGESFAVGRFGCVVVRARRSARLSTRSGAAEALRVLDPTGERAASLLADIAKSGINALIVAATNRDLSSEIADERFRRDLYFRLDGVTLHIPPLRERRDQIVRLAMQFLKAAHAKRAAGERLPLMPEVLKRIEDHSWPRQHPRENYRSRPPRCRGCRRGE